MYSYRLWTSIDSFLVKLCKSISTYKLLLVSTVSNISEQYLSTGSAVAVSLVVVEAYSIMLTHDIQIVLHIGKELPSGLDSAEITYGLLPCDIVGG